MLIFSGKDFQLLVYKKALNSFKNNLSYNYYKDVAERVRTLKDANTLLKQGFCDSFPSNHTEVMLRKFVIMKGDVDTRQIETEYDFKFKYITFFKIFYEVKPAFMYKDINIILPAVSLCNKHITCGNNDPLVYNPQLIWHFNGPSFVLNWFHQ